MFCDLRARWNVEATPHSLQLSSAAYLWLKATEPTPAAPTFANVVPMRSRALRVEVGGAAVVVESGFDAELLRQIVAALGAGA
jgi:hypothetical protein